MNPIKNDDNQHTAGFPTTYQEADLPGVLGPEFSAMGKMLRKPMGFLVIWGVNP
jgi:hypothetical protein